MRLDQTRMSFHSFVAFRFQRTHTDTHTLKYSHALNTFFFFFKWVKASSLKQADFICPDPSLSKTNVVSPDHKCTCIDLGCTPAPTLYDYFSLLVLIYGNHFYSVKQMHTKPLFFSLCTWDFYLILLPTLHHLLVLVIFHCLDFANRIFLLCMGFISHRHLVNSPQTILGNM